MISRGDTIDKAIALKDDADVVAKLRERMPEALEMLARIACGDVPRNSLSILKAIETQLRFTQPLPKQVVEHQGAVGISVINPYAEDGGGSEESSGPRAAALAVLPASSTTAALPPAPAPVAPLRRRKKAPAEPQE